MQARVFAKIEEIARLHRGRRVAVFTHGGPCKAALFAALGLPARLGRRWVVSNASLHRLLWEETPGGDVWRLAGFNDTAHMNDLSQAPDPSALTEEEKE